MKLCPNCEHEANDKDIFCLMCGTPLPDFSINQINPSADLETTTNVEKKPETESEIQKTEPDVKTAYVPKKSVQRSFFYKQQPLVQSNYTFLNTGIGIVYFALILTAAIITVLKVREHFEINAMLSQFGYYALAAVAITLSVRAKGPDLSIGAVVEAAPIAMSIFYLNSGFNYDSPVLPVILTISAGTVLGLLNGVFIAFLKIPAIVMTLFTGIVIKYFNLLSSFENRIAVAQVGIASNNVTLLIITSFVAIAAFLFILFTRLGVPTYSRDSNKPKISFMFAYMTSAAIASGAGILMLGYRAVEAPMVESAEIYIIFIFSLLISSRIFDNKYAPIPLSLVSAAVWVLIRNIFVFSLYGQLFVIGATFIALAVAYMSRCVKKDNAYAINNDSSLVQ